MSMNHYKYVREIIEHPLNRSRKLRSILRYLRWNVGRRLLDDVDYSIELVPGTRIVLSNRENYATLAYTCGVYDFQEMLFMMHFLRQGDCIGDFGANVGVYSILAGSRGASVLAVEPVPETFERLCANLRMNAINAVPVNCGLSDRREVVRFTTDRGGMNKVATRVGPNTCEVEVMPADELISRTKLAPCLLKIDVEGYEHPLLSGAKELLSSTVLAIFIEMNQSGREYGFSDESVHLLLLESGFSPYRYDPRSREIIARDGINRDGINQSALNTIYLRRTALPLLRERVKEAEPVNFRQVSV